MAVEITGSLYTSNSADDDIVVTVPADADGCIVVTGRYAGFGLSKLSWDDVATVDFALIVAGGSGGNFTCRAHYMLSNNADWPGSGEHTLSIVFDEGAYGPWTAVFFVKGVDTDDTIVDTDNDSGTEDWTASLAGVAGGDLTIIAKATYLQVIDADPAGSGQTALLESAASSDMRLGIGYEDGEGAPVIETDSGSYTGNIAFALAAAAAGGSVVPADILLGLGSFNGGFLDG